MRSLDDDAFRKTCELQSFRGSGPGGQKRNKTSSGVRLVHPPTGLAAVATVDRSQRSNMKDAIRSLRLELAFNVRCDPPASASMPMATPGMASYPLAVAEAFDVLEARGWSMRDAAAALGGTTGQLARWLTQDPLVLAAANRHRRVRELKPLGGRD